MSYLSGGALGTQVGPAFVRRLQDSERPSVLAALLGVLGLQFAACTAVAVLVLAHDDDGSMTLVVVPVALLLAAGTAPMIAETVTRWWWRGRRSGTVVLRPAHSGAPSTAILRSRAALVTPWTNGLLLTGWCVFVATATPLPTWWRAGFVLLAVAVSSWLWALVLGRAGPGGVYLTAEALELRWGVVSTTVPWTHLGPSLLDGPLGPLQRGGLLRVPGTTERRSFAVQMATPLVDRVPGHVVIPLPYLAMEPKAMWAYVNLVARSPHLRPHLGTARSLEWHVDPA